MTGLLLLGGVLVGYALAAIPSAPHPGYVLMLGVGSACVLAAAIYHEGLTK